MKEIVEIFNNFRMPTTPIDEYEKTGKQVLADKLQKFAVNNEPIEFVMLGLPFKSINSRDKVLGLLPDLGEEVMIRNFNRFTSLIKEVYAPGANITVVSDGFIFNDILKVSDHIVEAYKEAADSMTSGGNVSIYDLRDFYHKRQSLPGSRLKVMEQFGITAEKLEQEILLNPDTNYLYRGMIRFMTEEVSVYNFPSGNQLHKEAKRIAREMMFRNEAYSNLVRHEFANYIRLSMHPSINNGAKYSFQLIPGGTHSPWHAATAYDGKQYETIHKKDAELAGYELQYKDGKPYNYFKK